MRLTTESSQGLRVAALAVLAAISGCAVLPEKPDVDDVRAFYLHEVRDPECAVASDKAIAGDPHRIFRIASLGKIFVDLALHRMEREGRIDLGRSVRSASRFDLPPEYEAVTLRDLLENRSGLPREFLNPWNPLDWHTALMCGLVGTHIYAGFESRDDFAAELSSRRSRAFLREGKPKYSNMGFALLTLCVEDMTGLTIDEIVRAELVEPLGLEDTTFCPVGEERERVAPPCSGKLPWLFRRGSGVPEHRLGPALRGMGSLFSSGLRCAGWVRCSRRRRTARRCSARTGSLWTRRWRGSPLARSPMARTCGSCVCARSGWRTERTGGYSTVSG